MTLSEKKLQIVAENKGIKAVDIVSQLSSQHKTAADKSQVNSILYGELKGKVWQDKRYCWHTKTAEGQKQAENKPKRQETLLTALSDYYLECTLKDIDSGVSEYASNQYGSPKYRVAQSEINIAIGNKEPSRYMSEILEQVNGGPKKYGNIVNIKDLKDNLRMNCIPDEFENMGTSSYPAFLSQRRILMAQKIKIYFEML